MGATLERMRDPSVVPLSDEVPTFSPDYGFKSPRKPREMIATDEQMFSAKVPLEVRDYCAHKLIDFQVCKRREFPWVYKCAHVNHVYLQCEYEDYVMRMKEFEREKRLRLRQQRLTGTA